MSWNRLESILSEVGQGPRPIEQNADAAYDNKTIRSYLKLKGIKCNIPPNNRNRKNPKRGGTIRFDEQAYRKRGCVDRFLDGLKLGSEDWQPDTSV